MDNSRPQVFDANPMALLIDTNQVPAPGDVVQSVEFSADKEAVWIKFTSGRVTVSHISRMGQHTSGASGNAGSAGGFAGNATRYAGECAKMDDDAHRSTLAWLSQFTPNPPAIKCTLFAGIDSPTQRQQLVAAQTIASCLDPDLCVSKMMEALKLENVDMYDAVVSMCGHWAVSLSGEPPATGTAEVQIIDRTLPPQVMIANRNAMVRVNVTGEPQKQSDLSQAHGPGAGRGILQHLVDGAAARGEARDHIVFDEHQHFDETQLPPVSRRLPDLGDVLTCVSYSPSKKEFVFSFSNGEFAHFDAVQVPRIREARVGNPPYTWHGQIEELLRDRRNNPAAVHSIPFPVTFQEAKLISGFSLPGGLWVGFTGEFDHSNFVPGLESFSCTAPAVTIADFSSSKVVPPCFGPNITQQWEQQPAGL